MERHVATYLHTRISMLFTFTRWVLAQKECGVLSLSSDDVVRDDRFLKVIFDTK
jgi:hypothetical protein